MDITIQDHQKKVRLNSFQIIKITKAILRHEQIGQATLSIVFVSHQKIRALNKQYLKRDHVTDVLAFDLSDHSVSKRQPLDRGLDRILRYQFDAIDDVA